MQAHMTPKPELLFKPSWFYTDPHPGLILGPTLTLILTLRLIQS